MYAWNVAALFLNQSKYLYFPKSEWAATPESIGLAYEDLTFKTQDGRVISGWFVRAGKGQTVVLMCHGNAGNISNRLDELRVFHELGLSSLVFDYGGYGKSEGSPSELSTYLDAEAAWRFLVEDKKVLPNEIIICGRSLGAAIAARLAAHQTPKALILESGFTSLADIAAQMYPRFPVRWLLKFRYDTLDQLQKVDCPVLVVHSLEDQVVPFTHGRRLYEAAKSPKQFLQISGRHNEGYVASEDKYKKGLQDFLDSIKL